MRGTRYVNFRMAIAMESVPYVPEIGAGPVFAEGARLDGRGLEEFRTICECWMVRDVEYVFMRYALARCNGGA